MMNTKNILLIIAVLMLPCAASAQKNAKKRAKVLPVEELEPTQEEINFEDLLPSTAKTIFIDSISAPASSYTENMRFAPSSGKVAMEKDGKFVVYSYTNELKNHKIISIPDKTGLHQLYNVSKLGNGWSEPERIEIPGDFSDLICPYLMADGVTLYFSARGGEGNVGNHDIFLTVYDNDTEKYITPQSVGLPFNSSADDYYYIIDEGNNIGYLATNRSQDSARVCVYPFIPTDTREVYNDIDDDTLTSLAKLTSISMTQTDMKKVTEARARLNGLSDDNNQTETFNFPINSEIAYHHIDDFKNAESKQLITEYLKRYNKYTQQVERLHSLRNNYHNGQRYTAKEITDLETFLQDEEIEIRNLATQIRNNENQ